MKRPLLAMISDVIAALGPRERPHFCGRKMNRLDDFRIGRATAEIANEVMANFLVAWIRMFGEQFLRHQDETRCTETALERTSLDKGFLNRIKIIAICEALDGLHICAIDKPGEHQATSNGAPVDENRTAAAKALPAAFARAFQVEFVLQQFNKRLPAPDDCRRLLAVQGEIDDALIAHINAPPHS